MESFGWLTPDYKVEKTTEKSVILKVYPGKSGSISKNKREYIKEELIRSARTATGKKMDVNHDHKQIGKIHLADFENDELEFVCEIWKEPFVSLLRTRSPEIKGFSIGASYLFNECPYCHEKFDSDSKFYNHMETKEVKPVSKQIPRGIIFDEYALSVVWGKEIPGLETRYEIVETLHGGYSGLLETVIKFKEKIEEEKYKMSKIALNKEIGTIAVGKSGIKGLAEQEEEPEQKQEQQHKCGEGEHWDEEKQACVKNESESPVAIEKLQLGEPCSPELKACVDKLIADGKEESSAWAICKSQLGETIKLRESKLDSVTLEPIKFEGFDSLLKETKDEIRAAQIVKQSREINEAFKNMAFTLNEIIMEINKPLTVKMPYIDESWRTQVKQLINTHQKLTEYIQALPKDDLGWKEIKPYNDSAIKEQIANIKPYDDKPLTEKIEASKYNDSELKQKLASMAEALKELPILKETITQQKKDFDNLLDSADKSVKEYFVANKKEMEADKAKIKELEEKLMEAEQKKLKETESLETRVDNLEDKLPALAKYKSVTKKLTETKTNSPDLTYKPGAK